MPAAHAARHGPTLAPFGRHHPATAALRAVLEQHRLAVAVLTAAAAVFAYRVGKLASLCAADDAGCTVAAGAEGMAVSALGAAAFGFAIGAVVTGLLRLRMSMLAGGATTATVAALVAATPVDVSWTNCNDMSATLAAGLAVPTLLAEPEDVPPSFAGWSTLMRCQRPSPWWYDGAQSRTSRSFAANASG